jgi:hypothetical protein
MTIDAARTGDDLLTAVAGIAPDARETALMGRGVTILREAADLCGVSYADTMTKRQAARAIAENF